MFCWMSIFEFNYFYLKTVVVTSFKSIKDEEFAQHVDHQQKGRVCPTVLEDNRISGPTSVYDRLCGRSLCTLKTHGAGWAGCPVPNCNIWN